MARLLNSTSFKSPNPAVVSFNVTIPSTTAGSTLICVAGGGAVITAKLNGTSFTKRTTSLSTREVAAQDIIDSGGSNTTIVISLNGAENVNGVIYEFAAGSLGSFIAGSTNAGTGGNSNIGSDGSVKIGSITTTGPAVLLSMFTVGDNTGITTPQRQFWGLSPLGKQFEGDGINTDPTKSLYWSMIGASDQTSAGTFNVQSASILFGNTHQSVAWAYQDLSGGVPSYPAYPNAIAAENSLPGIYYSTWFASASSATSPNISGFTDSQSYSPGSTVNFKVFSNNVGFNVIITRLGYYGYFIFSGRTVTTVAGTPVVQPAPTVNSYGGTTCAWTTNATWNIPANATPGIYTYLLQRTDNTGYIMMGTFIVKSPKPSSKATGMMVTTADFTWQAYNVWGSTADGGGGYGSFSGRSLYGTAPSSIVNTSRAYAVSYDRPQGVVSNNDETYYFDSEAGLVSFLEGNGYDVSYYSMADLDIDPTIPSYYTTAIVSGHSEYWSHNVRNAFENARDNGTNLMFFSSNTSLWHVRFDPADTNRRNIICYKDSHSTTGYDNTTKYDPISYTGTWRDPRTTGGGVNNTERRPESGMTGQWFIGNGTFTEHVAVPNTYSSLPIWRNTTIATGATIITRATTSGNMTTAANSYTVNTPAGTQMNDLILIAMVFNGNPGSITANGLRIVYTQTSDDANLTTVLMQVYANTAGSSAYLISWSGNLIASMVCSVYGGAVWEDSSSTVAADTSGSSSHTTVATSSAGTNRWAIAVFADVDSTGSSKTTSWTAGAGLTSRAQANNSASASGSWASIAIMDTNGGVTAGSHQYSATAQFANPNAATGMMYISPGTVLYPSTIGAEWDYLKTEEPSTPANLVMLSRQATQINSQRSDYYGATYGNNGTLFYGITLYKAPSGALVFNTGSWRFAWGLSRWRAAALDINGSVDVNMQQATINILGDFGHTPTTLLGAGNSASPALVAPGSKNTPGSYGLDAASTPDYKSIFIPSLVPQATNSNDGTDYTLGTVFSADTNGQVYGARWLFPDNLPTQPVVATLYSWTSDTSGVQLASATFTDVQTGWNSVLFSSPVNITANTKYVITIWTHEYYVGTTGFFSSASTVNGDLTAPQDVAGAHNGKLIGGHGSSAYPTQSFGSSGYYVDVLFIGSGTVQFEGWGIPID